MSKDQKEIYISTFAIIKHVLLLFVCFCFFMKISMLLNGSALDEDFCFVPAVVYTLYIVFCDHLYVNWKNHTVCLFVSSSVQGGYHRRYFFELIQTERILNDHKIKQIANFYRKIMWIKIVLSLVSFVLPVMIYEVSIIPKNLKIFGVLLFIGSAISVIICRSIEKKYRIPENIEDAIDLHMSTSNNVTRKYELYPLSPYKWCIVGLFLLFICLHIS